MINGKGDPPKLETIIKVLRMTTSDNDNIALMAIRNANTQLAAWGWDWESIMKGKVKIMPDPFASIPMPTATQPGTYSRPAAAPPPPPKQFDNAKEIEGYLSKLELGPRLSDTVQQQLNSIERKWNTNGFLLWSDYTYLRTEANKRRKR